MEANKKITVYSLEDATHSIELFEYMAENEISDIAEFFTDTEADKLQIDGNIILFTRIEMPQSNIIIFWDSNYETDEKQIKEILTQFFSPDFTSYFERKTAIWSEFKDNCIAFRDGKGSIYNIWQYSNFEIKQNGKTVLQSNNSLYMLFKNLVGLNFTGEEYNKYLQFAKQTFKTGKIELIKNGLILQTGIIP